MDGIDSTTDTEATDTPPTADAPERAAELTTESGAPTDTDGTEGTAPAREYLHVQPSTDASTPDLETVCTRLHQLGETADTRPLIECLLTTPGDGTITYAFGTEDVPVDRLRSILRTAFPESYDITAASGPESAHLDDRDAALELYGVPERGDDWQTALESVHDEDGLTTLPLPSIAEALATADGPATYQVLLRPEPDWTPDADYRCEQIKLGNDTPAQQFFTFLTGDYKTELPSLEDLPTQTRRRVEAIQQVDARHSFAVTVRAVAAGPEATDTLEEIAAALTAQSGPYYRLTPRLHTEDQNAVEAVTTALQQRAHADSPSFGTRLRQRLPGTSNASPRIVAGPEAVPAFWLLAGDQLGADARRAFDATPGERTGVPHPEPEVLAQYQQPGFLLGYPLTAENEPAETPVTLAPQLQPLHIGMIGRTGSGKSVALGNGMLTNQAATEGADILIEPKGDGMPVDYLRAHYAKHGDLEDVYYFDCREVLPALSFFDIRDELEAGIDRTTAIEDVADHYIELLVAIMGEEQFHRAVRSPDIIRYLVKALFDPVHGSDAFAHRQLQDTARRMHETRDAPPVTDDDLEAMLGGVAANSKRSFDELMQGVANRIEKVPLDERLGRLFNHVPDDADPQFDFREYLDEDAVVIIDTGGLRSESQRALTLVLLSNLWTALRRRAEDTDSDPPLVNLYLEEAASVATSGLMTDLLAQSRGFGLSVTLAMQFPAQLRTSDHEAYAEFLNNVSTLVTGNVAVDDDLAKRLATDDMEPGDVANRLRALERGQWFASLPAEFGQAQPRPFVLESAPLPPGHPDGAEPLSEIEQTAFRAALDAVVDRTRREAGIPVTGPQPVTTDDADEDSPTQQTAHTDAARTPHPLDSALPYTQRLPDMVVYDEQRLALVCDNCGNRYDRDATGMRRAIQCCHSLAAVDRDDVPVCKVNLKLSREECAESDYSIRQLLFMQAVYMAHQQEYDTELEYDIVWDSMRRLQEYVGVDNEAVQDLVDDDLLARDCTHPHRLYTVTPAGRDEIAISHREGIAHGDGKGDLSESSFHVAMVEVADRYLQQEYVDDPDSVVVETRKYPEVDGQRLDLIGVDADGEVVVTVEAERSNNDTLRAVPEDYDKMAACEPEEAIWIVPKQEAARDVVEALNDPPEGEPRVEKTYSRNTPPSSFTIDQPGFTDAYTFTAVQNRLE